MFNAVAMIRPLLRQQTVCSMSWFGGASAIGYSRRSVHIEKKIDKLGIELPTAPLPKANYNIVCLPPGENILYVSGHLPINVSAQCTDTLYGNAVACSCILYLIPTSYQQINT